MSYELKKHDPSLLILPDLLLEKILGYLSFDEISSLRIVCCKFNEIIKSLLNRGFRRVERYHAKCLKEVKSRLPRRESERRDHLLAPLCNILSGIETRLSLLNMTFLKYIDADMCCFIPGKVIDEIYRVLHFVQQTKTNFLSYANKMQKPAERIDNFEKLRANIILKELRDISSMAMEYFEEKILPSLKSPDVMTDANCSSAHLTITLPPYSPLSTPGSRASVSSGYDNSPCVSGEIFSTFQSAYSKNKMSIFSFKQQVKDLQSKLNDSCRKINEQELMIQEMNRVLTEQNNKFTESEGKIAELNKKVVDNECKLSALLNIVNNESSSYASTSTLHQATPIKSRSNDSAAGTSEKSKKNDDMSPSGSNVKGGRRDSSKKRKLPSFDTDTDNQSPKKINFGDTNK